MQYVHHHIIALCKFIYVTGHGTLLSRAAVLLLVLYGPLQLYYF